MPLSARAVGFQVDSSGTLMANLVDYWSGSSLTGEFTSNILTNNYSVTVGTSSGKIDKTFDFGSNNTTKYLSISSALGMTGATSKSMCAWIKSQTGNGANSGIMEWSSASPNDLLEQIRIDGTTDARVLRLSSVNDNVTDTVNVEDGAWHFVCSRWDGSTLTGNVDNRTAVAVSSTATSGGGDTNGFQLGMHYTSAQPWSGYISEVGVWSKKLSNQEIVDLWNNGNGDAFNGGSAPYIGIDTLKQYKSDATTTLSIGNSTDEDTVVFGAQVFAAIPSATAQLQVEIRPVGVQFTNTSTTTSVATSSGNYITKSVNFTDPRSYHWQARVLDSNNNTSTWQLFGNGTSSTDFIVDPADSAYFNGSSAWKWPATNLGFNSTDPFTIEFWYRTTIASTTQIQFIDTRSNSSSNGFAVWREQNGINFSMNCGNNSSTVHFVDAGALANAYSANFPWHHVAITKGSTSSSTDNFKFYFDGSQQTSDKCYASTSTDSIWIGGNPSSSMSLFSGKIDEVRIWNTERSASDIATSSTHEVSATSTGLVGYWRFNATSTDLVTGHASSWQYGNPTYFLDTPFGHFIFGFSSVSSSVINYNASTSYAQWEAGVHTWNSSTTGAVSITSTTLANAGLQIIEVSNSDYNTVGGEYCNIQYWYLYGCALAGSSCPAKDTIYLNTYEMDTETSTNKQFITTHELGHALNLAHSTSGNIMYPYINSQTWLGPQDIKDYNYLYKP